MEQRLTKQSRSLSKRSPGVFQTVRASDWWEFKLAPIFATIYATAFILNLSITSLWPLLLLALIALIPGAAYVSLINDLTDLEDDVASGKNNQLVGRSKTFVTIALACCLVPGVAVSFYWRNDPLILSLYLAAWIAFSVYSIPPFRLKTRGLSGLLADASGAHLFPTLLVVSLVYRWGGIPIEPLWFLAVAVWSLCYGLRGNLWHQLTDLQNDQLAGLKTFAQRHTITWLHGLGNFIIFPLEIAAFSIMLWRAGSRLAIAFLCCYALLEWLRKRLWKMNLVIAVPKPRYSILLLEYYEIFFPLAVLLSSSRQHPLDVLVLVAHLIIFPRRGAQVGKDVFKLTKKVIDKFAQA